MAIELQNNKTRITVKELKEILANHTDNELLELYFCEYETVVLLGNDEILKYYE